VIQSPRGDLAHANGHYIAWENVAPAPMLQVSIESFRGDVSNLAAIIHENLLRDDVEPVAAHKLIVGRTRWRRNAYPVTS
jgi:hypothetical protein